MTKIKSVEEVEQTIEYVISDRAEILDGDTKSKEVQKIITQDRQAFEEAIVEALERMKRDTKVVRSLGQDRTLYGLERYNQALNQVIATIRSIYQDNK